MTRLPGKFILYHISSGNQGVDGCPEPCFRRLATAGVTLFQIRERRLSTRQVLKIAWNLKRRLKDMEARILLNDRFDVALAAGLDGVHLRSGGLPIQRVRDLTPEEFIIGRSAHSLEEVYQAAEEGADFVTLGPVFQTPSKPGSIKALGVPSLMEIVSKVDIPVFALGGICSQVTPDVLNAGVSGLAGIRFFHDQEELNKILALKP